MKKFFAMIFALAILLSAAKQAAAEALEENVIRIDLEQRKLTLSKGGKEVAEFPIAIPRHALKNLPWEGEAIGAEKNPSWHPTKNIKEYYLEKKGIELPDHLAPGDPRNAMGKGKILIHFTNLNVTDPIRIHGTNDEASIGQKVTRGCIRLRNSDILRLINLIKDEPTRIIILKAA